MPAKILIVDDEAVVAEHIRSILLQLSYIVAGTAGSMDEALAAAGAAAPDLVLMDINLGADQEGITAADAIRTRHDIPVVFLTAYADEATLFRARITHPFGYVLKPFQVRELHIAIEIALYNHEIERRLRESEQRFSLVMQASNDGLWDWDIATGRTYYNAAYGEMLCYRQGELEAHVDFWREHLHPEDRAAALQANLDCIEGRTDRFEVEFRMQAKHGHWVWILAKGRVVGRDSGGRALRLVGTHTDITERKRILAVLAEQAETHRALLSTTLDGVLETDDEARILDVNQAYRQMLGYTREELVGKSVAHVEGVETPQEVARHAARMRREGGGHFESRHRGKDGRLVDVDVSITYIPQGRRFIVFVRDITKRKQMEMALRESEEKFSLAFHASPVAMAIRDLETDRYVEVNDRCLALVGYAREEVVGRSPFEIGWMSDGDREENRRILLVAEGVKERELRLRRKDGCSIICVYSSHPVRIAGRPCLLSCSLDITERKQAELRDAEQLAELRRWQALMIQRSDRNQELKREVNDLLHRLGESPRHPSQVAQPVDTTMTIEALPAERSRRALLDTLEDQAQAEAARRESEGKYRVLFESMAEGMALHELVCDAADGRPVDYRIIECNPGFEKHTGLSAVAARGQLASRFFGADPAPYLDIYAEVVRTGTARTFETYYPPLNRHFFISAFVPSPGRFATIFVDISASKEAERLLKQKMENLERFQAVAVNRELQMIELKDEINALLRKSGAPEKYRIVG